jgi:uncharacterized DUF497 family protein
MDKREKVQAVSFDEAQTIFGDRLARTDPEPDDSEGEERFTAIGLALSVGVITKAQFTTGRLLASVHAG